MYCVINSILPFLYRATPFSDTNPWLRVPHSELHIIWVDTEVDTPSGRTWTDFISWSWSEKDRLERSIKGAEDTRNRWNHTAVSCRSRRRSRAGADSCYTYTFIIMIRAILCRTLASVADLYRSGNVLLTHSDALTILVFVMDVYSSHAGIQIHSPFLRSLPSSSLLRLVALTKSYIVCGGR